MFPVLTIVIFSDFFFSSLCELLEDQIQYHLNYPPSPTLDEQLRLLIQVRP
jgi:hypothetical protein